MGFEKHGITVGIKKVSETVRNKTGMPLFQA